MTFLFEILKFNEMSSIVFFLVLILPLLTLFITVDKNYYEKSTPYECGFHPYEDSRKEFSIDFYAVAVFFIIFDLEILITLPWIAVLPFICVGSYLFWFGFSFLLILVLAFVVEWRSGALLW